MSKTDKKYDILIIDDDYDVSMVIIDMLNSINCRIYRAENGKDAIEFLKILNIDLIILDILLPDMHGFSVASSIRSLPKCKKIPIIMITAVYKKTKYKILAKNMGISALLYKPIKMSTLLQEVNKIFEKAQV